MTSHVERRQAALQRAIVMVADSIRRQITLLAALAHEAKEDPVRRLASLRELMTALAAETGLLNSAPAEELTDAAAERALLAWLWGPPLRSAADLVSAVASDAVPRATGAGTPLTDAAAAAVVALVGPQRPGPSLAQGIRQAAGGEAAMDALVAVALRRRLAVAEADRDVLMRDVSVLLPLRLETLFRQDGQTWTMLLRITPDEASIRRDDPAATPTEIALLTRMWQSAFAAVGPADLAYPPSYWFTSDLCRPAWELFCKQVSPARAAWLVGRFPPTVGADTITVEADATDHRAPANRVGGFPAEIEIWCAFAGESEAVCLAVTKVDASALAFDVVGERVTDDGTIIAQSDRWWVSWPAAKAVGLGLEIPLPDRRGPADIATLYAIGLGDENPAEHFRAQINAGEFASLSLGAPTNAVDGSQAANLGHDASDWLDTAVYRLRDQSDQLLGRWLTGDATALPASPRAGGIADLDQMLVRSLWPVLWGHHLREIWDFGEDADRLAAWAGQWLRPEGQLPPIRISEQPYGLLPVSEATAWAVASEEGDMAACEERMLSTLLLLRDAAANAARQRGNAVGADTVGLLDLLGHDATSAGYAYRLFLPVQYWTALWGATTGVDPERFAEAVKKTFEPATELFGKEPHRQYLAAGDPGAVPIPLVVPTAWPYWFWQPGRFDEEGNPVPAMAVETGLARLVETLLGAPSSSHDYARELWRNVLPNSLLIRLLLHASMLARAAVVQFDSGINGPLLEPIVGSTTTDTLLRSLSGMWSEALPHDHPAGTVQELHRQGLEQLFKVFMSEPPGGVTAAVERAFRSTLETAMHRVDPWLVGMATRRLNYLAAQPDTRFRLGVYGWVDGPMRGSPGPTTSGLLHAPSHAQALTAAILRDKAVTDKLVDPGGRELWSMQLDSNRIRVADEIAEEVRIGAHLYEAVGRRVERVIGTSEGVRTLRSLFPLHQGQDAAGRVCSGVTALTALLSATPPLVVSAGQVTTLTALRDGLDAYGDLLVAEAVHQVVTGRAEVAGAAMDAAAGLASPPTLAFTETPLTAEGLTSAVVSVVPFVASQSGDGISPVLIADASVVAAVEAMTGPASAWTWEDVTLADLGLAPADALVLSADLLSSLAQYRLGAPPLSGTGPVFHRRALDLVGTLGAQPALASDVASAKPDDDVAGIAALDAAILAELRTRYLALRDEAQRTIAALSSASDPPTWVAALRRALRWGITPMVGKSEQQALFGALLDGAVPADQQLLPSLAARAAESLAARLKAAPAVDARVPIGRSIAELAAPDGRLAVLAGIPLQSLVAVSGLVLSADADIDTDWLPVVAAVRPQLARLEALQLAAFIGHQPGFVAASSAPGDPWRTSALAALLASRGQPGESVRSSLPRLVAAYGLGNVWNEGPDAMLAVGLIDSWSEAVPQPRQTTTAVFGFNAPSARPPQAILIAVPPDLAASYGVPADTSALVRVLAETRQLSHARAVRAEDLGGLLAALPTTMLQGTGETGVKLDGTGF